MIDRHTLVMDADVSEGHNTSAALCNRAIDRTNVTRMPVTTDKAKYYPPELRAALPNRLSGARSQRAHTPLPAARGLQPLGHQLLRRTPTLVTRPQRVPGCIPRARRPERSRWSPSRVLVLTVLSGSPWLLAISACVIPPKYAISMTSR